MSDRVWVPSGFPRARELPMASALVWKAMDFSQEKNEFQLRRTAERRHKLTLFKVVRYA